jgi:hypothetical protein
MQLFRGDKEDWFRAISAFILSLIIASIVFNIVFPFGTCQQSPSIGDLISCLLSSPLWFLQFIFPFPESFLGLGVIGMIASAIYLGIALAIFLILYLVFSYITFKKALHTNRKSKYGKLKK